MWDKACEERVFGPLCLLFLTTTATRPPLPLSGFLYATNRAKNVHFTWEDHQQMFNWQYTRNLEV